MSSMRKLAAVAAAVVLASALPAGAQEMRHDLHAQSVSPEASRGVNPGTTRGVERGLPSATPALEPRGELVSSTTRVTSAKWANAEQPASERWRPHRPVLIAGVAIFLGAYGASAITGATVGSDADRNLLIPVAGPWIALGGRSESCAFGTCGFHGDINLIGVVASGVVQAAGLALAVTSLFVEEPRERTQAKVVIVPGAAFGRF